MEEKTDLSLEALIGRSRLKFDKNKISQSLEYLKQKNVLITGACGSIGKAIVTRLLDSGVNNLILIDSHEQGVFHLNKLVKEKYTSSNCKIFVADICNKKEITEIFQTSAPEVVIHAAANKHVGLSEDNPKHALKINVFGTENLALISTDFKVEKFLFISTDKANKPTTFMGKTKFLAERVLMHIVPEGKLHIVAFGNVIGSSGSVVQIFEKQIKEGKPLTIRNKLMERFFMLPDEAVDLCLFSLSGYDGKMIYKIQSPTKIEDLALNMMKQLNKNVDIIYEDALPTEKITESLELTPYYQTKSVKILQQSKDDKDYILYDDFDVNPQLNRLNYSHITQQIKEVVSSNYPNLIFKKEIMSI